MSKPVPEFTERRLDQLASEAEAIEDRLCGKLRPQGEERRQLKARLAQLNRDMAAVIGTLT